MYQNFFFNFAIFKNFQKFCKFPSFFFQFFSIFFTFRGYEYAILQLCNQPQDEWCWDYEVRFCCEEKITEMKIGECENGEWTSWDDRDDPSATGDWEPLYLGTAAEICDFPIAAEARIIGSSDLFTTQNVQLTLEDRVLKCTAVSTLKFRFEPRLGFLMIFDF